MVRQCFAVLLSISGVAWATGTGVGAQPLPPLPVQTCSDMRIGVAGKMSGVWESRRDARHPGRFEVTIDLNCSGGAPGVQVRNLEIHAQELADND